MKREDFKILAKEIKTKLSVGGTFKDDSIIIQEITDKIMEILKLKIQSKTCGRIKVSTN
jgi:translation initiation factor 1